MGATCRACGDPDRSVDDCKNGCATRRCSRPRTRQRIKLALLVGPGRQHRRCGTLAKHRLDLTPCSAMGAQLGFKNNIRIRPAQIQSALNLPACFLWLPRVEPLLRFRFCCFLAITSRRGASPKRNAERWPSLVLPDGARAQEPGGVDWRRAWFRAGVDVRCGWLRDGTAVST